MIYYLSTVVYFRNGNVLKFQTDENEDEQKVIDVMTNLNNIFDQAKRNDMNGTLHFNPDKSSSAIIDVREVIALEMNVLP